MLDTLWDWLSTFWETLLEYISWLLYGIKYLLELGFLSLIQLLFKILVWLFFTIYDGLLSSIESFFSTLDFSSDIFGSTIGHSMPDLLVWFVDQLGLAQCISLLCTALVLRATLNLIPGTITRI